MRSLGWLRKERSSLKKESSSLTDLSNYFWQKCFPGAVSSDTTQAVIDQMSFFSKNAASSSSSMVKSTINEEEKSSTAIEIGFDPPVGAPASIFPSVASETLAASSLLLSSSSSSSFLSDPQLKICPSADEKLRIVRYLESKCGRITSASSSSSSSSSSSFLTLNTSTLLSTQNTDHTVEDGDASFAIGLAPFSSSSSSSTVKPNTIFTNSSRGIGTFLDKISRLRNKDPASIASPTEADEVGEEGGGGGRGPNSASKRKDQMAEVDGWKLMLDSKRLKTRNQELLDSLFDRGNALPSRDVKVIFSRAMEAAKPHIDNLLDDVIAAGPMGLETRSMRAFIEFRRQKKEQKEESEKAKSGAGIAKEEMEEEEEEEDKNERSEERTTEKEGKSIKFSSFGRYSPFVQDAALRLSLQQQQQQSITSSSSSSSLSNPKVSVLRAVPFDCDVFVNVSATRGFRKLYTQPARGVDSSSKDDENNQDASGLSPVFIWSSMSPSRYNSSTLMVVFRHILHQVLKNPHIDEASIIRSTPASPPGNTRMILRFLSRLGMLKRTFRLAQDAELIFAKPTLYSRTLEPWEDIGYERDGGGGGGGGSDLRLAEADFLSNLKSSIPACADHVSTLSDAVLLWEDAAATIAVAQGAHYSEKSKSRRGVDLIVRLESLPASECPISGGIITQYCASSSSQTILALLGESLG